MNSFPFSQKIDSYQNLSKEIASLHITVPLNMLCLNCDDVNKELSARAARLADRMIHYVVDQNRDKNRGYARVLEKLQLWPISSMRCSYRESWWFYSSKQRSSSR